MARAHANGFKSKFGNESKKRVQYTLNDWQIRGGQKVEPLLEEEEEVSTAKDKHVCILFPGLLFCFLSKKDDTCLRSNRFAFLNRVLVQIFNVENPWFHVVKKDDRTISRLP